MLHELLFLCDSLPSSTRRCDYCAFSACCTLGSSLHSSTRRCRFLFGNAVLTPLNATPFVSSLRSSLGRSRTESEGQLEEREEVGGGDEEGDEDYTKDYYASDDEEGGDEGGEAVF